MACGYDSLLAASVVLRKLLPNRRANVSYLYHQHFVLPYPFCMERPFFGASRMVACRGAS